MEVRLSKVRDNPYNTRTDYGDLDGLKASITRLGLTQPFIVRESDEGYELAFGSRRYRALLEMGKKTVEVEVRKISNPDMVMLAICENTHRKDLNPVEQARAYERGLNATGLELGDFSKTIGVSRTKIKEYLNILNLPKKILDNVGDYSVAELTSMGRMQNLSQSLRIVLENALSNRQIGARFLEQITFSCESIYGSILPTKTKADLCSEVILHDYSALPPDNYRDIKTFSDELLRQSLTKYTQGLAKTAAARAKSPAPGSRTRIKRVTDIVHIDQRLEDVTTRVSETAASIKKAIEKDYYQKASDRKKSKFRTAVRHLVSGIEEILGNERFRS